MDKLTLKGLSYRGKHGYHEEERIEGNDFEVDLVFWADLDRAGRSDELSHTLDYQRAEQLVREIMEGPSLKLIETLAHRIGEKLFDELQEIEKLQVKVRKLNPPLPSPTNYSEICKTWNR